MESSDFHSSPQFPYHPTPRTWLIISGLSALGLRLARILLAHGDNIVLGIPPATFDEVSISNPSLLSTPFRRHESELLRQFLLQDIPPLPSDGSPAAAEAGSSDVADWHARFRPVRLDPRATAQCQGAVAQTVGYFGGLDVLVCNSSEVLIGTVEELAEREETRSMLREQFEVGFFANVNAIKAAVPVMRRQAGRAAASEAAAAVGAGNGGGGILGGGHIVVVTGITSHLGTPGLGAFCASGWALEGYCDSIAYEIAPFNIRLSIVQPHLETAVLPNRIKSVPLMPQYSPSSHPAPLARNSIGSLLDRIHNISPGDSSTSPSDPSNSSSPPTNPPSTHRRDSSTTTETDDPNSKSTGARGARSTPKSLGSKSDVTVHEPRLPEQMADALLEETLFSICAIGGHPNPPQRHIVGTEGVVSVKEKLKTVSMELEDLVGTSAAVDVDGEGIGELGA